MEMNWSLSELNKLTPTVQGLKDDPEGCACVVGKTDVWKYTGNIDLLVDLCTKH